MDEAFEQASLGNSQPNTSGSDRNLPARATSEETTSSKKPRSRTKSSRTVSNGKKPARGDRSSKAKSPKAPVQAAQSAKGSPWTFPKNTLEDAIKITKAIEDKNAGNPMPANELATAVGFRQSSDWRFLDLLRSANQYGLVAGSGATAFIALTKLGQDIVAPSSPSQRSEALLGAFRTVKDFESVEDFYGGKRIPEDEFFLNTLTRQFSIPRDRVDVFARIFQENLRYLKAFSRPQIDDTAVRSPADVSDGMKIPAKTNNQVPARDAATREFLDTCFVMMPFGEWFNRYYKEIYIPAIKEAGFEPVRGDELFNTGSVVEQIWDQIEKSKVLLADLSGKNANVFYELGLAHAARKPVVFTAANVEDVPFDLRHLRVIIYDVREPEWATRLRTSIADYLRNAARDPGKSIPHPFRNTLEERFVSTASLQES